MSVIVAIFLPIIKFTPLASRQKRGYYESAMNIFDSFKDNEFIKVLGDRPTPCRFASKSDLQKAPIGENTKFLYYIYKDEVGYHSDWAWSDNLADLTEFLLDYLIAKAMFKEVDMSANNSDGLETHCLQESLVLYLVEAIKNRTIDPKFLAEFNTALAEFLNASDKGEDLNLASQNLMDFTSGLFYSLTWNFFDGLDETKAALKSHNINIQNDNIADSLLRDKSI